MTSQIILVGFMGVGKTTIGQLLSKKLDLPFFDIDKIIEYENNMSVLDIFNLKGETYFREEELRVITNVLINDKFVISTGGGLPMHDNLMEILLKNGSVIWLCKSINKLLLQIRNDKSRPKASLNYSNLRNLYQNRLPVYKEAHKKILVNKEPNYIADRIIDYIS
jgi:shikimate kinase